MLLWISQTSQNVTKGFQMCHDHFKHVFQCSAVLLSCLCAPYQKSQYGNIALVCPKWSPQTSLIRVQAMHSYLHMHKKTTSNLFKNIQQLSQTRFTNYYIYAFMAAALKSSFNDPNRNKNGSNKHEAVEIFLGEGPWTPNTSAAIIWNNFVLLF